MQTTFYSRGINFCLRSKRNIENDSLKTASKDQFRLNYIRIFASFLPPPTNVPFSFFPHLPFSIEKKREILAYTQTIFVFHFSRLNFYLNRLFSSLYFLSAKSFDLIGFLFFFVFFFVFCFFCCFFCFVFFCKFY